MNDAALQRVPGAGDTCRAGESDAASGASDTGSRRRRLWELPDESHCPVVGVCLPLPVLRRIAGKLHTLPASLGDYELHACVVQECSRRGPLTEALQRELDRRCALSLHRFAAARCGDALAVLWREAVQRGDIAQALWATLTHARCDAALAVQVCRDVHMQQHQAGAMARADVHSLRDLEQRNTTLEHELARERERCIALQEQRGAETAVLGAQLMRVRAELIGKDTQLAALQDERARLRTLAPDLELRRELKQRVAEMAERQRELQRCNDTLRAQLLEAAAAAPVQSPADAAPRPLLRAAPTQLEQRAVLCVGGRGGDISRYRSCIEGRGGRFLHHDGGIEDNPRLLDSSLAAADLVICQAGCVSHNAYWLVKEHCKRTGKRCVFIDRPGVATLARGLREVLASEPGNLMS